MAEASVAEGELYDVKVDAKNPNGEGIGRLDNFVIFIRNAKTKIGKIYKVRITKVYRTFAYAEPVEGNEGNKYFIGNGTVII
ncbi:MAG: TRAM domain-containing protein [Candidatus Micrarchaeia archaeon]|jgi:predicted RNA-binding protein with TRAM domain